MGGETDTAGRTNITGAVVDFLESRGVQTYAMDRRPSSIVVSLPNEPSLALERHVEALKGRLQQVRFEPQLDVVARDPRDDHAIIIEIKAPHDERRRRDAVVGTLREAESELRRRGVERLLLFGSAATLMPHPNDIDLLVRFRADVRPSAFDIADIQAYLEEKLGRRVDLSTESAFPDAFRQTAEKTGIGIFGS